MHTDAKESLRWSRVRLVLFFVSILATVTCPGYAVQFSLHREEQQLDGWRETLLTFCSQLLGMSCCDLNFPEPQGERNEH